jgi:alpha-glucosidase
LKINRSDSGDALIDTTSQPMYYKDQYLQMTTALPTNYNIYGLGEHVKPLRLQVNKAYTLWNLSDRDTPGHNCMYLVEFV